MLSYRLHHGRAERAGELGFFWGYHAAACFLLYETREQAVLRAAAGEADVAVVGDAGEKVSRALRDGVEEAEADRVFVRALGEQADDFRLRKDGAHVVDGLERSPFRDIAEVGELAAEMDGHVLEEAARTGGAFVVHQEV